MASVVSGSQIYQIQDTRYKIQRRRVQSLNLCEAGMIGLLTGVYPVQYSTRQSSRVKQRQSKDKGKVNRDYQSSLTHRLRTTDE